MSNHVTDWLNAYLDGELQGSHLYHVETHLIRCEVCQAELKSLERLSGLLQQAPLPGFTPPERFAAKVSLRLPHPKPLDKRKKVLEIGWWMVPVGLFGTWVLLSAFFGVTDLLSMANRFGFLTSISDWMMFGTANAADWSTALGQFGVLRGSTLDFVLSTETMIRTSLPQISLQISIALLYLSWMAIWWARHRRQGYSQPLER